MFSFLTDHGSRERRRVAETQTAGEESGEQLRENNRGETIVSCYQQETLANMSMLEQL